MSEPDSYAAVKSVQKSLTFGEGGLAVVFALLALGCITVAAKAQDSAYAFHAYLSAFASLASVFVILNRYIDRPAALPAREIEGKPN